MLITFAFILTPLIPLQDPILRRTPIDLEKINQGRKAKEHLNTEFLREKDWNKFRAGLSKWVRDGRFSEAALNQAMRHDSALVRANALIAWGSPTAWGHWRDEKVFRYPSPGDAYLTDTDQELWGILINHLRDDQLRNNFAWSSQYLWGHWEAALPALEKALTDEDRQLNYEVRRILLHKQFNVRNATLDKALLEHLDYYAERHRGVGRRGFQRMFSPGDQAWLVHHGVRFYPMLKNWLLGVDEEKQVIAAHVFARRNWQGYEGEVVSLLVQQLSDDIRRGNASIALKALFLMGKQALPWLEKITTYSDLQQETALKLLIWDIKDPPKNWADLRLRKAKLPTYLLCNHCFDPLLQHLGPFFYLPFDCAIEEGGCLGTDTHQYWEFKRSACPCGAHLCDVKLREMEEVVGVMRPSTESF